MANLAPAYQTLEEIQQRKDELADALDKKRDRVATLWYGLFTPKRATTRGELAASILSNCITAYDAFMLVRKLMRQYGHLFHRSEGKRRR